MLAINKISNVKDNNKLIEKSKKLLKIKKLFKLRKLKNKKISKS